MDKLRKKAARKHKAKLSKAECSRFRSLMWEFRRRVITKRCYGVKSVGTFFNRIVLDANRPSEAVGRSIVEVREIIAGPKAVFLQYCT